LSTLDNILYPVVAEAILCIDTAKSLKQEPEATLFGDSALDSMGLVRFIVMVEERIEDELDVSLTLASEKAMSRKRSPFRSLQALADFIDECLAEQADG
jgi:acyl carrier protein